MKLGYDKLESLYKKYNRREFVHPDPLEFLYYYTDERDIEIVGLIASSLAYGKAAQILKSIEKVLLKLKPSPYQFIIDNSIRNFEDAFNGFKHRFTTEKDIVNLFCGIKSVLRKYGSLKKCFIAGYSEEDKTYIPAINNFSKILNSIFLNSKILNSKFLLIPCPDNGSACKRLMLFLRWMIRNDDVDPGCWNDLPLSKLIMPLDTHIYKIGLNTGFTKRKSADLRTAVEITEKFAIVNSKDPVKYDFVLTRFGIRGDLDWNLI